MNRAAHANPTSRALALACAACVVIAYALFPASIGLADTPHVVASVDTDSCAACHVAHTTRPSDTLGVVRTNADATCLPCHSSGSKAANIVTGARDSFGLSSGHSLVASSTGSAHVNSCSVCHRVHAASAVSPMIPADRINGAEVTTSGPEVCLACHDKDDSWFGSDYPSTASPSHDASGYPVSGTWPGPDTYKSATNAHRLIPETTQTIAGSGGVRRQQGDCLYCHAAHRGPNAYDGLLTTFTVPAESTLASDQAEGSYAALCFECHGGTAPSGFDTTPVNIKQFVTDPTTTTVGVVGHSVVTSGGTLPVGAPLPCFECHNPHGSKRGNASLISDERGGSLETSTAAGVRDFCFTCHTTNDTIAGWDSATKSYVAVAQDDKVVGLPRDGGLLRLTTELGHNEVDTSSCYDCHGNSYASDGRNVHNPVSTGQLAFISIDASRTQPASDTVPPVTTADLAAAYAGTVMLRAADDGSGVAQTYYSLDGAVLTTGTVVTAAGDGTHTVQFWSVDNASNVETPTVAEFFVDQTAPITTSDALPTYADSATITLVSQDTTDGSGVAATYWRLDGGDVATGTVVTTSTVGPHTLEFWATDVAGNTALPQTVTFTITDSSQAMVGGSPFALRSVPPPGPATQASGVVARESSGWPDGLAPGVAPGPATG